MTTFEKYGEILISHFLQQIHLLVITHDKNLVIFEFLYDE